MKHEQFDALSNLFLDISKGSFLAAVTIPVLKEVNLFFFVRTIILGIMCALFSLQFIALKGEK